MIINNLKKYYSLIFGLFIITAFIFQSNILYKSIQLLIIIFFIFLMGEKIRVLNIIIMSFSIILLSLLTPIGKIYFNIFGLIITKGALLVGTKKILVVIGLIYISKLMLTNNFQIPGYFGFIITKVFQNFEIFTKHKFLFKKDNNSTSFETIIKNIDNLFIKLTDKNNNSLKLEHKKLPAKLIKMKYFIILAIINWLILIMSWII